MVAGLMNIVRFLNRSWIYDTYFSLYLELFIRGKSELRGMSEGEMSGYYHRRSIRHRLDFKTAYNYRPYNKFVYSKDDYSNSARLHLGLRRFRSGFNTPNESVSVIKFEKMNKNMLVGFLLGRIPVSNVPRANVRRPRLH